MKPLKCFTLPFVTLFFACNLFAQTAPDFNLTDSGGNIHRLYQDYLNNGKVVVIKIFFVNCPPCNAIAAEVQQKYVQWGSGTGDVQFIEISNKVSDNNNLVNGYKAQHGITFPSVGGAGGGPAATQPYMNGTFGQWYGTPTFVVVSPSGAVNFNVDLNDLNTAIQAAIPGVVAPPTTVNISSNYPAGIPSGVKILMKPAGAASPVLDIGLLTNYTYHFDYPSTNFPELEDPIIYIQSTATAKNNQLNVADLLAMQKHIVSITKFTKEQELIAADVTNDKKINSADLVLLKHVVVGTQLNFPNVPSYVLYPNTINLSPPDNGGGSINLNIELIKMGNVK